MSTYLGRRVRWRANWTITLLLTPLFYLVFVPGTQAQDPGSTEIKLGAGAYHWFNLNRDSGDFNYGIPSLRDTYFWHIDADVDHHYDASTDIGLHTQVRFRETDLFRPFLQSQVWLYELYGYVDTSYGKFKLGKIWSRFGLDWDGSFYGNVPYFDGFKLDPDWGAAWEKNWKLDERFSLTSHVQYFLQEDRVNGSIAGADAESTPLREEQHTFNARVVPRWQLDSDIALELGGSFRIGNIKNLAGPDDTETAGAVDATLTWRKLKLFGEVMFSSGTLNPAFYVTGGPSDEYNDYLVGAQYSLGKLPIAGPVTLRYTYSTGDYKHPRGDQGLSLYGVTANPFDWLTVYVEYVDWNVDPAGAPRVKYEDGFQFIFYWNLSRVFKFK